MTTAVATLRRTLVVCPCGRKLGAMTLEDGRRDHRQCSKCKRITTVQIKRQHDGSLGVTFTDATP